MDIGFTGTQVGMTTNQLHALAGLIHDQWWDIDSIHHGDCMGADEQFHAIAVLYDLHIVQHPPINDSKRAFCKEGIILEPKEYLERNHDIVNATDLLIAAPRTLKEELRSGTWATIRYARKLGRKVRILEP